MKNRVKEVRKQRALSQSDLAALVQVSRQTIISIEKGRYIPSTLLSMKMAHYLEVTMEELFQLEDPDLNQETN